jgi:hypothetical protein
MIAKRLPHDVIGVPVCSDESCSRKNLEPDDNSKQQIPFQPSGLIHRQRRQPRGGHFSGGGPFARGASWTFCCTGRNC